MNGWYPEQQYTSVRQYPYIHCGSRNTSLPSCTSEDKYCLFDVADDPCEYNNIASLLPELSELLYERLMRYAAAAQPPRNKPADPKSDPKRHNGHWTDWMDKNPVNSTNV